MEWAKGEVGGSCNNVNIKKKYKAAKKNMPFLICFQEMLIWLFQKPYCKNHCLKTFIGLIVEKESKFK